MKPNTLYVIPTLISLAVAIPTASKREPQLGGLLGGLGGLGGLTGGLGGLTGGLGGLPGVGSLAGGLPAVGGLTGGALGGIGGGSGGSGSGGSSGGGDDGGSGDGGYGDDSSTPTGQCNVGPMQCCDQVVPASDAAAQTALGLIGIVLQDLNIPIGLDCSSITVIGGGNGACHAAPVCCDDNSNGGLVSIGCVPISI